LLFIWRETGAPQAKVSTSTDEQLKDSLVVKCSPRKCTVASFRLAPFYDLSSRSSPVGHQREGSSSAELVHHLLHQRHESVLHVHSLLLDAQRSLLQVDLLLAQLLLSAESLALVLALLSSVLILLGHEWFRAPASVSSRQALQPPPHQCLPVFWRLELSTIQAHL
jgi:hypothetical protein